MRQLESTKPRTVLANDKLQVRLGEGAGGVFIECVAVRTPRGWETIATGSAGQEFATSVGSADATVGPGAAHELRFAAITEWWEASAVITLAPDQPVLRRTQTYRFRKECVAAIHPGWRIPSARAVRYTFPLRAHEQPLADLPPLRSDVAWALPLPFHVWHNQDWVALYGVDRTRSPGTIDFLPPDRLRVYYPDTAHQSGGLPEMPQTRQFAAGEQITITEVLAAKSLGNNAFGVPPLGGSDRMPPEGGTPNEEPLLEAERIAAGILLRFPSREGLGVGATSAGRDERLEPTPGPSGGGERLTAIADGIAEFYRHCELWNRDAFGPGRGWFQNMWVFTQRGPAAKTGHMSGYFDLGWGEGIAVETIVALTRYWRRTGRTDLLVYVDEMTRNLELFKRDAAPDAPYYDRSDGKRFGDFLMDHVPGQRVWTHSLGHTGSQLLTAYEDAPHYPQPAVRARWLETARGIGWFFANRQRASGDLQDIFDDQDREVNAKPHRISARAVVCGLWARLARLTGDKSWLDRAGRLARAVAPEIERYEYFNQMLDGIMSPAAEYIDGEAAYYVLEGLVPLYEAMRDAPVLALCRKAAAFGIAWTYFYDLPQAHRGIARGGQCCRMPDYPLLYPIGPAKAVEPLLRLACATGDEFYRQMAGEMVAFISQYQFECPGKPWDGGMIHAIEQWSGKHWGPEKSGQVDSGMATGNSLAALEFWLATAG